jgi:hypothetical protein
MAQDGVEHDLRAVQVRAQAPQRLVNDCVHADGRCQMEHAVAIGYQAVDQSLVEHRSADEPEACAIQQRQQIDRRACGQIVEGEDRVAPIQQGFTKMRANESSPARDQCPHVALDIAI